MRDLEIQKLKISETQNKKASQNILRCFFIIENLLIIFAFLCDFARDLISHQVTKSPRNFESISQSQCQCLSSKFIKDSFSQ